MIGALPTNVCRCNNCNVWKPISQFTIDCHKSNGFRKTCRDCVNRNASAKREAMRQVRLKERLREVPFIAIVRMCKEDPDIFQRVMNVDARRFRAIYAEEKAKFIANERAKTERAQARPQVQPEFHEFKRKKIDWIDAASL